MKISRLCLVSLLCGTGCLLAQVARVDTAKTTQRIVATGPHERIVQTLTRGTAPDGQAAIFTNSYVQLETGLNVWSDKDQAWVESNPSIELLDNGAVARGTQHRVAFGATLDDPAGAVHLVMPDGQEMRIRVLGLALTDARDPARSVLIAEPTERAQGYLVGENRIVYPEALGPGIDVVYTVTRWGLEQDIALNTKLPDPAAEFGIEDARVEVWSEIIEGADPKATSDTQSVDWGSMRLGLGRAFLAADASAASETVSASWLRAEGRRFIVEAIPFASVEAMQSELPPSASIINTSKARSLLAKAAGGAGRVPVSVATGGSKPKTQGLLAAISRRDMPLRKGITLDWQAVNATLTNYVFRGSYTYYVSGPTSLNGTNTSFMGGCVIKYAPTNTASLTLYTPVSWLSSSYRPIILTARDDASVGEAITNAAISGTYANPALTIRQNGTHLHDLRCSYAQVGLFFHDFSAGTSGSNVVSHAQFVQCPVPMQFNGYGTSFQNFQARNVLVQSATSVFKGYSFSGTVEHLTVDTCTRLAEDYNGQVPGTTSTLSLKNSLIASMGSYYGSRAVTINLNSPYTQVLGSGSGVWTTVGAGAYYLAVGSPYRNTGTTGIGSPLVDEIKSLTTYPPNVLSGTVALPTTWSPQAMRDTDIPDLGYHYSPLDVLVNSVAVTNTTLTLTNGVAVGHCGNAALWLQAGSSLVSEGSPIARNHLTRYTCVQEQATNLANGNVSGNVAINPYTASGTYPNATLRFTDFETPASDGYHVYEMDPSSFVFGSISFKDCSLNAGRLFLGGPAGTSVEIVNSALTESSISWAGSSVLNAFNNIVSGGVLDADCYGVGTWTIKDNAFDECALTDFMGNTTHGNNAYISSSGNPGRFMPTNLYDKPLTSFPWQTGPLGRFYQTAGGTLANAGSRSAPSAGLFHYTSTTDQAKESSSTVDIGVHYVVLDANKQPWDYDGDGVADYREDRNGNGAANSGELNWQSKTDLGFRVWITEPKSNANLP